jgi:hypothetical protein
MYELLNKLGVIQYANPIAKVDKVRVHERQLSYLSTGQITELLDKLGKCKNTSVFFCCSVVLENGIALGGS